MLNCLYFSFSLLSTFFRLNAVKKLPGMAKCSTSLGCDCFVKKTYLASAYRHYLVEGFSEIFFESKYFF